MLTKLPIVCFNYSLIGYFLEAIFLMTVLSRMQVLYIPEVSTRFFAGPVEEKSLML